MNENRDTHPGRLVHNLATEATDRMLAVIEFMTRCDPLACGAYFSDDRQEASGSGQRGEPESRSLEPKGITEPVRVRVMRAGRRMDGNQTWQARRSRAHA